MSTIKIKRSQTTAVPSTLAEGELAYSEVSNKLFIGKTGNNVEVIAGAGEFAKTDSPNFTGTPQAPTPNTADSSQKIATTQFVKDQGFLQANQEITVSGDATGSGVAAITLTLADTTVTPGQYTKVTVDSKGRVTDATSLVANDIPVLTAAKISDFNTQVRVNRLDQLAQPQADVDMNNRKLTGLALPTQNADAATKQYVDYVAQGLDVKHSVRVATRYNITLADVQTIDAITVVAGDRVLVKNQNDPKENGIYVVVAGAAWTRAEDFDNSGSLAAEVTSGAFCFVEEGEIGIATGWVLATPNNPSYLINNVPAVELGVQDINFTQFNGAGGVSGVAGPGLWINAGEITVGAGTGISTTANAVQIDPTWTGQAAITTVGTIGTGAWQGSAVDVPYGGTGVTSLTGIVKGNGTSAFSAALAGTDYLAPDSEIDGGTF